MDKDIRNRTAHTYNEQTANEIIASIRERHVTHLDALRDTFERLQREQRE